MLKIEKMRPDTPRLKITYQIIGAVKQYSNLHRIAALSDLREKIDH
jgi:hypothetical protein